MYTYSGKDGCGCEGKRDLTHPKLSPFESHVDEGKREACQKGARVGESEPTEEESKERFVHA